MFIFDTLKGMGIEARNEYCPSGEGVTTMPMQVGGQNPPMVGPIYHGIETTNKYNPLVEARVQAASELSGPIYAGDGIDIHNQYKGPEGERVHGQLAMVGPVYHGVDVKNQFVPPTAKVSGPFEIKGPVMPGGEHKFNLVETEGWKNKLESQPEVLHPILPTERQHKYNMVTAEGYKGNKEIDSGMTAPIYSGFERKSNYHPQADEKPHPDVPLMGPKYGGLDNTSSFCPSGEQVTTMPAQIGGPQNPPMVGPIYHGIETTNQYNPLVEARVQAATELAGPVYGVETKNVYGPIPERAPGGEMLAGPIYHGVQVKNEFVPPLEKVQSAKTLNGPVLQGVGGEHKYNLVETEGWKNRLESDPNVQHPILPTERQHKFNMVEAEGFKKVESVKGMLGPIYNVLHDHHYREIISNALILSDLGGKIDKDMAVNMYSPEAPQVPEIKTLLGPVYDILNEHHYNQINNVAHELKTLQNPVFVPEARHHYSEIGKNVEKLELLSGPVYNIKRDHVFREIFKSIDKIKKLQGPVYDLGLPAHHFQAINEHVDAIKNLQGPIYDQDGKMKSHYNGVIEHVEALKELTGPIYKYGEVGHKYEGSHLLEPAATEQRQLHGPKYDIDR